MDVISNRRAIMLVMNRKLGIPGLRNIVLEFALEFYFTENQVTTFVSEKMYLRMLCFQLADYLQPSTLRLVKNSEDGGYFHTYADTLRYVSMNYLYCIQHLYGKWTPHDNDKANITLGQIWPVAQDKRLHIYYQQEKDATWIVSGFVDSDEEFLFRIVKYS
jgi:hypothetical protein